MGHLNLPSLRFFLTLFNKLIMVLVICFFVFVVGLMVIPLHWSQTHSLGSSKEENPGCGPVSISISISIYWKFKGPSGPQLLVGGLAGPSGRLDFVLRALLVLRPCDCGVRAHGERAHAHHAVLFDGRTRRF